MKKIIFTLTLINSLLFFAQENNETKKSDSEILNMIKEKLESSINEPEPKLTYIIMAKIGFSKLNIDNYGIINGNYTQADFLLSSKLSNKLRLEYGLGISEFSANNFQNNQIFEINNRYYSLPINLVYNKDFNAKASYLLGIGLRVNYLSKSEIGNYFSGRNVGLNLGLNLQLGINFKLNKEMDFRIMYEGQTDLTKISNEFMKLRQNNTSLFSISLVYKF